MALVVLIFYACTQACRPLRVRSAPRPRSRSSVGRVGRTRSSPRAFKIGRRDRICPRFSKSRLKRQTQSYAKQDGRARQAPNRSATQILRAKSTVFLHCFYAWFLALSVTIQHWNCRLFRMEFRGLICLPGNLAGLSAKSVSVHILGLN